MTGMHSELQELRWIQGEQREAHLERDPQRLVALFADDFVQVRSGTIERPSRDECLEHFRQYFDRISFVAWDDVTEPEIRVSDDASLATVIVHKRVHVRYQDETGASAEQETIFAWQETYLRRDGRWQLAVVVSTNTPPVQQPVGST